MTNVFGKYVNYNTIIHRADPRLKIFCLIAFMVMCFLPYGNFMNTYAVLLILVLVIATLMIISKLSFLDFFKSLKFMWFMAIFLLIINVFIPYNGKTDLHEMIVFSNGYIIYWEGVMNTFMVLIRLIMMVALTMIFTATTTPMDITYGFERFLYPLKLLKIPTQVVAMTMSLALRFIPTLLLEANRIMKAQKSRGVDYNRGLISRKIKSITTLIVPLLVSCFSISDDLSLAMNARGYDPYAKRTRYRVLTFKKADLFLIISILILLAGFITISVFANSVGINLLETIFRELPKGSTF